MTRKEPEMVREILSAVTAKALVALTHAVPEK